ncbi:hypothetical protein TSUD_356620 [Trifolium subterraneum]|uniref:Uncharacterized protein n=1 Tax=Trifolium subterraneum TaxID=3900 RepID=A0A2Z6M5T2_TRISU|nr:hypothetical protein TSUD_356620 [Trifolium subterraneum]
MAPSSSKSKAQLFDENKVAIDKGKSVNLVELKEARDKEKKLQDQLEYLKDRKMELEGGGS